MKLITLIVLALAPAAASAQSLESISARDLRETSAFEVPAARTANFYLDAGSYDPLLMSGKPGQRLHVIGGKIEIPGINGDLEFARQYRQLAYSRHDLQSDVALAVYTKNLPKTLFQVLFGIIQDNGNPAGGTYNDINPVVQDPQVAPMPTEEQIKALDIPADEKERMIVQLHNSKLQIDGRINPFRKKEMLNMMMQIINEERANGIEPRFGEPHEWSPQFIQYCKDKGEVIPLNFTKLLTALASGVTSRHFKTGTEAALINEILARQDNSMTMDQAFRASYRLNNGDVYLTILTIENILSDNWRHPERDKLAVTRKLAVINNFYNGKGDKYGSWYHFHGIMLYGYVRGGLRAALIGATESVGSHILSGGVDEQQEDYVNSTGGKIGARLAKIMRDKVYLSFRPDRDYCDPNVYLDLTEDFRDRIEFVESKEFKADLRENGLWLKSLNRDYLDCHVEVMYNDYTGKLNSKNLVKQDHVDFKAGKSRYFGISTFDELTIARAFISGCLQQQARGGGPQRGFRVDAAR